VALRKTRGDLPTVRPEPVKEDPINLLVSTSTAMSRRTLISTFANHKFLINELTLLVKLVGC